MTDGGSSVDRPASTRRLTMRREGDATTLVPGTRAKAPPLPPEPEQRIEAPTSHPSTGANARNSAVNRRAGAERNAESNRFTGTSGAAARSGSSGHDREAGHRAPERTVIDPGLRTHDSDGGVHDGAVRPKSDRRRSTRRASVAAPSGTSSIKPVATPVINPAAQPALQPVIKPAHRAVVRPSGKLAAKPTDQHLPTPVANDPPSNPRETDRGQSRPARRRVFRWSRSTEFAASLAALLVVAAALVRFIHDETPLWLPLDAAHFVAEAEWLRGSRDLLPGIHPPLFPTLVLVFETMVDSWSAVLYAMCLSYALYLLAIYALMRRWHDRGVAFASTAVAAMTPVLAEMLGWGGGANLLGLATAIAALAAADRWVNSAKGGWLVGLTVGLSIATHPVAALMAVFFVGARLGWEIIGRTRRWVRPNTPGATDGEVTVEPSLPLSPPPQTGRWFRRPRGITSPVAWVMGAAAGFPFVLVSSYYYFGVQAPSQSKLGFPDLSVLSSLLGWAGREHQFIAAVNLVAVISPFLLFHRRSQPAALSVAALLILGTTVVKGDPSYQSRFVYLLPVLVAIAIAEVGVPLVRRTAAMLRQSSHALPLAVTVVTVLLIAQTGFFVRLDAAVAYYGRVKQSDLAVLTRSVTADGLAVSSHWAASTAEPTSWFVNAAASEPAWSPIGPWLSTSAEETVFGGKLQRFFAGQVGVENGRLQASIAGTDEGYYSIRIAASFAGWYYPLAELDVARTRWPFAVVSAAAIVADDEKLLLTLRGRRPVEVIELRIELRDESVRMTAESKATEDNDWHVVFAPAGGPWTASRVDSTEVSTRHLVGGTREVTSNLRIVGSGAPARATLYGASDPLDFDVIGSERVQFLWKARAGYTAAGEVAVFDEHALADDVGATRVVVWRNTGLAERFITDCYAEIDRSDSVIVFDRVDSCRP